MKKIIFKIGISALSVLGVASCKEKSTGIGKGSSVEGGGSGGTPTIELIDEVDRVLFDKFLNAESNIEELLTNLNK